MCSKCEEAKRAFKSLTLEIYQREAAYRVVIDGMTEWLEHPGSACACMGCPHKINCRCQCAVCYRESSLELLTNLKTSALSGLRSLPPPTSESD